jgi:nitronate monooxygenase
MRELEMPFWLAGSYGSPDGLTLALEQGAAGIQVGTAFAFCMESGLREDIKRQVLRMSRLGAVDVLTDPVASPTGFPFKVLQLEGSLSDSTVYNQRERMCDLGFLRQAYRRSDGRIGWRCPGEPLESYLRKGGEYADTVNRKCICNALIANVGLAQIRPGRGEEMPLVTCGNQAGNIAHFAPSDDAAMYTARDVIDHLLSGGANAGSTTSNRLLSQFLK